MTKEIGQINLDPTEDFLEARQLTALVDRWLDSLDVSPITLITYRGKIKHFTAWWDAKGPTVEWRLTRKLLQDFEVSLRGIQSKRFKRGLTYESRHATIRAVRMMFKWAAGSGRTSRNYGEWVPWPAGSTPARKSITQAQLTDLMFAAGESRQPLRDQAILAFMIGTGARRSEVAGLNVDDLTFEADGSGTALIVGKRTSANEDGRRAVGFAASVGKYLRAYMTDFVITAGPLWLNDDGNPMVGDGIYQMVKRAIKRAGLEAHIRGPHDLRRAFATLLAMRNPNNPGWADLIRRQLGHKHYSMTAHYTLMDANDIRQRLVSPLDGVLT